MTAPLLRGSLSALSHGELVRRLEIATHVATSWRDAAMRWGSIEMEGRVAAHPLSLVLGALEGEAEPIELGISPTDPAWAAIQAARATNQGQER